MKIRIVSLLMLLFLFTPRGARGEDTTLYLTIKSESGQGFFKKELRAGIWQSGQDGIDPLDLGAMPNGLFDAYFDNDLSPTGSRHLLWWDIRSRNPVQEWKLQVRSPSKAPIILEWKVVPFRTVTGPVHFTMTDTDSGKQYDFSSESGTEVLPTTGLKNLLIDSRPE
jgi:hypothetical protein